jgi:hypothetical protein
MRNDHWGQGQRAGLNEPRRKIMTIQIPLSKGRGGITIIDDIDADLAISKWHVNNLGRKSFYATRQERKKRVWLHRIILERALGRPIAKTEIPDHINGDTLDNRRCNLRISTKRQNSQNRRIHINKTGYKGVYKSDNKYYAQLQRRGMKTVCSHGFQTAEEAAREYDRMAIECFGEFAATNFPQ